MRYRLAVLLISIIFLSTEGSLYAQTPREIFKLIPINITPRLNTDIIYQSVVKFFKNITDLMDRASDLLKFAGTNAWGPENQFPGVTLADFYPQNSTKVFTDTEFAQISGRILRERFSSPIELTKTREDINAPVTIYLNDGTSIIGNGYVKAKESVKINLDNMTVTIFSEEINHIETSPEI